MYLCRPEQNRVATRLCSTMDSMWVSGTQDAGSIPARATSLTKNPSKYWGFFNLESILVSVKVRNANECFDIIAKKKLFLKKNI